MSKNKNKNDDDSSYLIMINTLSNNINIKVNKDIAKQGSIVQKKDYKDYNLSFSISDFKKLLKELFRITNNKAVFEFYFFG